MEEEKEDMDVAVDLANWELTGVSIEWGEEEEEDHLFFAADPCASFFLKEPQYLMGEASTPATTGEADLQAMTSTKKRRR